MKSLNVKQRLENLLINIIFSFLSESAKFERADLIK